MEISVPLALLLDQELTPSAKLVWMLVRLHSGASIPRLAAQSGLTPDTIRRALPRVTALPAPMGTTVPMPAHLLTDPRSRVAPVKYTLCDPVLNQQQQEVKLAWLRIQRDPNKGEAIMKEFLALLVNSTEFEDNARPGFLINPKTKERLELDRYYINTAAFEYNGESHFGTTDQATDQQTRDLVKVGICALRQIPVVIIHSEDLSLAGIRAKIGNLLPLRDLKGHEPLIAYLERRARRYREEDTQQNT